MRGRRLVPAGGEPAHIFAKVAHARAHHETSISAINSVMRKLARQQAASAPEAPEPLGEYAGYAPGGQFEAEPTSVVPSVQSPESPLSEPLRPSHGLGRDDLPVRAEALLEGLHEGMLESAEESEKSAVYRQPTPPPPLRPRVLRKKPISAAARAAAAPIRGVLKRLVPGALLASAAYGLYKGVPAAARFAKQQGARPMAYNYGLSQHPYGYSSEG